MAAPLTRPGELVTVALDRTTGAELRLLMWGDRHHAAGREELAAAAWILKRGIAYFRQAVGPGFAGYARFHHIVAD